MTFYWWSHWFWITASCCFVLLLILPSNCVHAYPSQESSSLESVNQNSAIDPKLAVTKLYQASSISSISGRDTTLDWGSSTQASLIRPLEAEEQEVEMEDRMGSGETAIERTKLQNVTPQKEWAQETATRESAIVDQEVEALLSSPFSRSEDGENVKTADGRSRMMIFEETDDVEEPMAAASGEESSIDDQGEDVDELMSDDGDFEFKRSAENFNKTDLGVIKSADLKESPDIMLKNNASLESSSKQLNNFTNFTAEGLNSTSNNINNNNNNTTISNSDISKSNPISFVGTITSIEAVAPPETPQIVATIANRSIASSSSSPSPVSGLDATSSASSSSSSFDDDRGDGGAIAPFTLENVNREDELRRAENERNRTRKSKGLSTNADYKHVNRFIVYPSTAAGAGGGVAGGGAAGPSAGDIKNLLARSASTVPNTASESDYDGEESNISSEALSIQRAYFLDAGAISAICLIAFSVCCVVGTVGIILYRRKFLNKPQALSEPDSSVYIDDSTLRVSDNSDEMYSLDNDSFLNSLEAMTIQNYWTDTVKHTKL